MKHKGQEKEESTNDKPNSETPVYRYYQMELLTKNITPEFEAQVSQRICRQVRIVQANPEDCERLVHLHNRAFLTATDPYCPISYSDMMKVLTFRDNIVLIGTIWGEDAGFIILGFDYYPSLEFDDSSDNILEVPAPPPERDGKRVYNVGYISGLGVDPRWRGRRVGTTLGVSSWKYFNAANLKKLKCEVYEKNEASFNLISRLGFRKVGVKTYSLEQSRAEPLRRL